MVAAGHSVDGVDSTRWEQTVDQVMGRVADAFGRVEPRRTARAYVAGLLSATERKNCWWLAENADHARPDAMQRLLRTACWDAEAVRDQVRSVVVERLGDPDGVLIVDLCRHRDYAECGGEGAGQRGRSGQLLGIILALAARSPSSDCTFRGGGNDGPPPGVEANHPDLPDTSTSPANNMP